MWLPLLVLGDGEAVGVGVVDQHEARAVLQRQLLAERQALQLLRVGKHHRGELRVRVLLLHHAYNWLKGTIMLIKR